MLGIHDLFLAVEQKDLGKIRACIDAGVNINVENAGETPLTKASKNGNLEIVEKLIEWGADVNFGSLKVKKPLALAVEKGHKVIAACLIKAGADVHVGVTPTYWSIREGNGSFDEPLFDYAIRTRDHELVAMLVNAYEFFLIGTDENKLTPLGRMISEGDAAMVELLIKLGVDLKLPVEVNYSDHIRTWALDLAILEMRRKKDKHEARVKIIEDLVSATTYDVNSEFLLLMSCIESFLPKHIEKILKLFLSAGAQLDERNEEGKNAWDYIRDIRSYVIREEVRQVLTGHLINSLANSENVNYVDWLKESFNCEAPLYSIQTKALRSQLTPIVNPSESCFSWLLWDDALMLEKNCKQFSGKK